MTLLTDLKLTPAAVPGLPAALRNKLLYFLLRWEAYADALACLDELAVDAYVSFQDMQADALEGLGRPAEAVAVMERRLEGSQAIAARQRLVRCLLHAGDLARARVEAEALVHHLR